MKTNLKSIENMNLNFALPILRTLIEYDVELIVEDGKLYGDFKLDDNGNLRDIAKKNIITLVS